MKNIPKKIYLQVPDNEDVKDFKDLFEVTWCVDKINDSDIEYIFAASDYKDPALKTLEENNFVRENDPRQKEEEKMNLSLFPSVINLIKKKD